MEGRPVLFASLGRAVVENGRVVEAALKICSAGRWATGLTFMVGLRALDGVRRPLRYQSKAKIKGFHLVIPGGTFPHVEGSII